MGGRGGWRGWVAGGAGRGAGGKGSGGGGQGGHLAERRYEKAEQHAVPRAEAAARSLGQPAATCGAREQPEGYREEEGVGDAVEWVGEARVAEAPRVERQPLADGQKEGLGQGGGRLGGGGGGGGRALPRCR